MADVELDVTFESSNVDLDVGFGEVYVIDGNTAVKVIANAYSNQSTYAIGDYVIYEKLLYRCVVAISEPEDFDSEKWLNIKLADDVSALQKEVDKKANTTDVNTALDTKLDKANPTGTGSFSLNRKASTTVGKNSGAVGDNCEASGVYSFAQGSYTKATGICGHSEGSGTEAFGLNSHSEGVRTVANRKSQHVFGEWNEVDDDGDNETVRGAYVEIVGNGTSNGRSNARTLDWQGNETLAGDLTFQGNRSLNTELGNKVNKSNITDEYDATSTYAIGDMVIHENALYVCSTAITTAEAWNSAHWTLTDIATAIGTVKTAIPTKTSDLQNDSGFAQIDDTEESASKTYSSEKIESIVEGKADESEVVELSEQVDSAVKKTITDKVITTRYVRTDLTTGIKQPSGTVVTSSSSGYTPIFPVTAGETITCKKYYLNSSGELKGGVDGTFGTIVFFADNTQTYTSWGESWNASKTSFVVPANAKYCQVTITAIMSGTYTIADVIQTTANGKTNYYLQQDTFKSPVRYIGSLTANKVQAIGEKICVDNYILSATMKVPQNFSSVKVGGRKEAGYDITLPTVEVTPTQVIIHSLLGNTFDITEAHGLTIVDDLQIVIEKNKFDKAKVIIQSGGSRFTVDNVNWGLSYYGYAIVSTENVTDVVVSLSVCDLYKPVWVCGDSWVTNFDSRWYGQALKLGVANFLKSGHAGEASVDGLNDLKTLLSMYKPKMIVWLYGMNDADTNDSTPNANWLASVQEIETICREQSIELVLATIPTTPTRNNNAKNDVVIASGYRYVDEVSAMGADNSGNWIEGYQSEDGNHTTEEGAKALLVRVLADVPEIALN